MYIDAGERPPREGHVPIQIGMVLASAPRPWTSKWPFPVDLGRQWDVANVAGGERAAKCVGHLSNSACGMEKDSGSEDVLADLDILSLVERRHRARTLGSENNTGDFEPLTEKDWEREINHVPLLMHHVPQNGKETSTALAAIQDLLYSGEPQEVAANFRHQGNVAVKEGRYEDAARFYSQGLDIPELEDASLKAVLYSNRAAVHWKLGRKRAALEDSKLALRLKPDHFKAIFRAAAASESLEKWEDAREWCDKGLKIEPTNRGLLAIKKKCEEVGRKEEQTAEKTRMMRKKLRAALRRRGLKLDLSGHRFAQDSKEKVIFVHIPDNILTLKYDVALDVLYWPLILCYGETHPADVVQHARETDLIGEHIFTVLESQDPSLEGRYRVEDVKLLTLDGGHVAMETEVGQLARTLDTADGALCLQVVLAC